MADLPPDLARELEEQLLRRDPQGRCFDINQYGPRPVSPTSGFKHEGTVQQQSARANAPKGEGVSH